MPTIKIYVSLGMCDHESSFEFADIEWEAMTEKERRDYLNEAVEIEIQNHVDAFAEVVQ